MIKSASAGTLESGDIFIEISSKQTQDVEIKLDSSVAHQFGKHIKQVIVDTLTDLGVKGVFINATDKGALDCTIKARVTTAVMRARGDTEIKW